MEEKLRFLKKLSRDADDEVLYDLCDNGDHMTLEEFKRKNSFLKGVVLKYCCKDWDETIDQLIRDVSCIQSSLPVSDTNSIHAGCQILLLQTEEKLRFLKKLSYDADDKVLYDLCL